MIWLAGSVFAAGWLYVALPKGGDGVTESSVAFLPGETTHGHHQIEMKCAACHLADGGVTDESCIDCHAAELKRSRDTHPKSKFNDPTKAELLQKIDAKNCLSCHIEHAEDQTHQMGVTVPDDYCFHCHQTVGEDRPSHHGLVFNSCATAGCHNYHDNSALYEKFLYKHLDEPECLKVATNPVRRLQQLLAAAGEPANSLTAKDADASPEGQNDIATQQWATSAHAMQGVNCSACHVDGSTTETATNETQTQWTASPAKGACAKCHETEVAGFDVGKHGMRAAIGLPSMTPAQARLPMHASAAHRDLNCSACHAAHAPSPAFAAYDACVSCHDDEHTRNYTNSAHFQLWQDEQDGTAAANSGVSCATCHMPRNEDGRVEHNQNANLRPNEKMARSVCLNCHGLQFTLDSLADEELKTNCYSKPPQQSVKSLEMAREWFDSKKRK